MRFQRWAPWIHALAVGLAAGGVLVVQYGGNLWQVGALVGVARAIGWLLAGNWRKPRAARRPRHCEVDDDVQALRDDVKRLCTIAHGFNNNLAVLLGELDLLVARLNNERRVSP